MSYIIFHFIHCLCYIHINISPLQYVDPVPNSGSFVHGSKVLHAARVYKPNSKAPHLDKNKDSVLRYVGDDQWQVLSDGEVIDKYSTNDLRISIVYRARCFKDASTAEAYKADTSVMDLENDIINRLKADLVTRGKATTERLEAMSRLELAFFIMDTYIQYPLPPADLSIIPYNYCAAASLFPVLSPLLNPFCNPQKKSKESVKEPQKGGGTTREDATKGGEG